MKRPLRQLLESCDPVILDGGLGSELERRGVDCGLPLWSANALVTSRDTLKQIHRDYIEAGAQIIATCTFRTTARTFKRARLRDQSEPLTRLAVQIARQARDESAAESALIAGSIGPLEDCYRPDLVPSDAELRDEHAEHAERLVAAGVELLFIETMGTIREARIAAEEAKKRGIEFAVSFLGAKTGAIYGGESLRDALNAIIPLGPSALCVNCLSPLVIQPLLDKFLEAMEEVPVLSRVALGVYANVGAITPDFTSPIAIEIGPDRYADFAKEWHKTGFKLIGGCCGTTPDHITALQKVFRG
jgi:S-methylmethionine-dependent homocysteine/selenocysteine methylase